MKRKNLKKEEDSFSPEKPESLDYETLNRNLNDAVLPVETLVQQLIDSSFKAYLAINIVFDKDKKENILKTLNSVFDPNGLVPSELFNLRYLRREIYKKGSALVAGEGFGNLSKIGVDFVDYGDHVQIYKKSKEPQEIEFLFHGLFDLIVLLSDDIRDKSSIYFKSGYSFNDGNSGLRKMGGRVLNNGKIDEFTFDEIGRLY